MVKVAQEILAYCSQCKMDLAATVAAMKGDQIIRVVCKTCRKERGYKAPKGITEPGQIPTQTTRRRTSSSHQASSASLPIEVEWKRLLLEHPGSARDYSTRTRFNLGDKIKHPSFGEGIVMKHIHPNKMEVIFQMDLKTLICGNVSE